MNPEQSPALSNDDAQLIISDSRQGSLAVDLATGTLTRHPSFESCPRQVHERAIEELRKQSIDTRPRE